MRIIIKPAIGGEDKTAMLRIRQAVFEQEQGIALARLRECDRTNALHLLAWAEPGGAPVAALSVVDTSGEDELHRSYGLRFDPSARTARYTQLAVLKPYRGMDIPLRMILAAHHQFIIPNQFDYTWLLFDARRAASSSLCRHLAFIPSTHTFPSEYGLSRALVRDEHAPRSERAIRQVERYLEQGLWPVSPTEPQLDPQALSVS
jgi:hypothetical protein